MGRQGLPPSWARAAARQLLVLRPSGSGPAAWRPAQEGAPAPAAWLGRSWARLSVCALAGELCFPSAAAVGLTGNRQVAV